MNTLQQALKVAQVVMILLLMSDAQEQIRKRIHFTDDERRSLVDAALAMGRDLMKQIVSIVKPETIIAWQRRLERAKWDYSHRRKKLGRPRIANDVEQLICQMARENRWGYKRIQGELKKLGIAISKGTVANVLYRNNLILLYLS